MVCQKPITCLRGCYLTVRIGMSRKSAAPFLQGSVVHLQKNTCLRASIHGSMIIMKRIQMIDTTNFAYVPGSLGAKEEAYYQLIA